MGVMEICWLKDLDHVCGNEVSYAEPAAFHEFVFRDACKIIPDDVWKKRPQMTVRPANRGVSEGLHDATGKIPAGELKVEFRRRIAVLKGTEAHGGHSHGIPHAGEGDGFIAEVEVWSGTGIAREDPGVPQSRGVRRQFTVSQRQGVCVPGRQRADLERRSMPARDARSLERAKRPALGVNGFELVEEPLGCADIGCLDGREVVHHSYPHIMWRPSITMSGPSPATGSGQQVQPPLHMVHGDCTLIDNDAYHFMFRMIAVHHPALCDAASAHPDDLAVFEVRHADRTSEICYARQTPRHDQQRGTSLQAVGFSRRIRPFRWRQRRFGRPVNLQLSQCLEDPQICRDAPDRWSIDERAPLSHPSSGASDSMLDHVP